jgi:ABC-type transport system involved in multi-copper enzyme maturation permease subunit
MSATSMVPVTAGRTAISGSAGRASFAGALRSEFTKIRSVRSTYWTLLATLVVVIGIGALFSYGAAHNFSQLPPGAQVASRAHEIAHATQRSLFGLILGQLIIAVLGALIRHTAGAITASFGLLFVLVILAGFLPTSWAVHVDKWVPTNAGGAIWEKVTGVHPFSPWTGFAIFCGYAALALAAGLYRFRNRDA